MKNIFAWLRNRAFFSQREHAVKHVRIDRSLDRLSAIKRAPWCCFIDCQIQDTFRCQTGIICEIRQKRLQSSSVQIKLENANAYQLFLDFSILMGWRNQIVYLYLFLFRSLLPLTPFFLKTKGKNAHKVPHEIGPLQSGEFLEVGEGVPGDVGDTAVDNGPVTESKKRKIDMGKTSFWQATIIGSNH